MSTAYFFDPAGLNHRTPPGHPERAERLQAVRAALDAPAFAALDRRSAPPADPAELLRCHPQDYIARIRAAIPGQGVRQLDADTHVSPGSWEAATGAVVLGTTSAAT